MVMDMKKPTSSLDIRRPININIELNPTYEYNSLKDLSVSVWWIKLKKKIAMFVLLIYANIVPNIRNAKI